MPAKLNDWSYHLGLAREDVGSQLFSHLIMFNQFLY
jgi:hypothetical protein